MSSFSLSVWSFVCAAVLGQPQASVVDDEPNVVSSHIIIRDDQTTAAHQALALQPQYAGIGRFAREGVFACSSTLLTPNWGITAAHCMATSFSFPFYPAYSYPILSLSSASYFGASGYASWMFYPDAYPAAAPIDEIVPFPEYSNSVADGLDLGLFRLFDDGLRAQPAALYRGNEEIGNATTIVGYGRLGTGSSGESSAAAFYNRMLAAENMVDALGSVIPISPGPGAYLVNFGFAWGMIRPTGLFCPCIQYFADIVGSARELAWDFDSPTNPSVSTLGNSTPLPLEGSLGGGDSGGPAFILEGGVPKLVGVSSSTASLVLPYRGYGTIGMATRVSVFQEWIDDYTNCASWDPDCTGDLAIESAQNWWFNGMRMAPGPDDSAVFNLPLIEAHLGPGGTIQISRSIVNLSLEAGASLKRLRVRRGTDLRLLLAGHTLDLTSESPWTTALTVGQMDSDSPVLRVSSGVVSAWDASVGELGGYISFDGAPYDPTGLYNLKSASRSEVIVENGGLLAIGDTLYLGDRAPTLAVPSGWRPRAGKGVLTIQTGGAVAIASRLRLGRSGDWIEVYRNCPPGEGCTSIFDESAGWLVMAGGTATIGTGPLEDLPNTLRISADGMLEGCGRIFGNVINSGGVLEVIDRFMGMTISRVGDPPPNPDCSIVVDPLFSGGACKFRGRQRIVGNYTQQAGAELRLDVSGTKPEVQHDVLEVSGIASLGGQLTVNTPVGYAPSVGASITIVTALQVVGAFDSLNLASLPADRRWQVQYLPQSVRLSVITAPPCAGDANASGSVDFGDITSVLANWGAIYMAGMSGNGDANNDDIVNFDDITAVLTNWGVVCP